MVATPAERFWIECVSGTSFVDDEFPVQGVAIPRAFGSSVCKLGLADHDRFMHPNGAEHCGSDWNPTENPAARMF